MRVGANVTFLHGDRLGSASLATDAAGSVLSQERYYVWGSASMMSGTMPTDFQWQNQRRLDEAQAGKLYDFNARFFTPVAARFISPDSIVPNPANPQSLNRYTAMANNPLNFTDPTGHYEACDDGACYSGSSNRNGTPVGSSPGGLTGRRVVRAHSYVLPRPKQRNNDPDVRYAPRSVSRAPARSHSPGPERGGADDSAVAYTGAGGATPGFVGFEGEISGTIADYDLLTYRTRIQGRAQYKFGPFDNPSGNHITNENIVAGGAQVSFGGRVEVAAITMPEARIGPWKLTHQLFVGFGTWSFESWQQYLGYEAVFTLSTDTVAGEFKTGIKQEFE